MENRKVDASFSEQEEILEDAAIKLSKLAPAVLEN